MATEQTSTSILDSQLVVSVATAIYYGYILAVTLRSNSEVFRSAFFVIFRVTGFFDIIGIFVVEWIRNDRKVGFGPSIEPFTRLMYAMSGINLFTHLIGCFLMTLNRFTAVCVPWAYEKIWSRKIVYIMLLIDSVVAVGVHVPLLLIPLVYERENNMWRLLGRKSQTPVIRVISCSTVVLYVCTTVLLISRTIYVSVKMNKKSRYPHKMGLIALVAIDCFLGIVDCIYEATDFLGLRGANVVFDWIDQNVTILFFIIMSINSYSIMFLSKDLRVEAIGPFRRKLKYWCTSTVIPTVTVSKH